MYDFFTSYLKNVLSVSTVALVCETICNIKGSEKLSKAVNLIISLCLFLSFFIPITKNASYDVSSYFDSNNSKKEINTEYYDNTFKNQLANSIKSNIYGIIKENLGITPSDIRIELNETQEKALYISSIEIILNQSLIEYGDKILEVLTDKLEADTKIKITEKHNEAEH